MYYYYYYYILKFKILSFPLCDMARFYLNNTLIILVLLFNFGSIFHGHKLNAVFWGVSAC